MQLMNMSLVAVRVARDDVLVAARAGKVCHSNFVRAGLGSERVKVLKSSN